MAVNATDFHRALKRVCDVFKIPALYSEQETAPTKTGEATGRFLTLQGVEVLRTCDILFVNTLLSSSISTDVKDALESSSATRFVACFWESLNWFEEGVGITLNGIGIVGDFWRGQSFQCCYSPREDSWEAPFVSSALTDNSHKCAWNRFPLYTAKIAIPLSL